MTQRGNQGLSATEEELALSEEPPPALLQELAEAEIARIKRSE